MAMPWQLARAKRPKRSEPRPLVEELPRLDIDDLCRWNVFPTQHEWHKAHYLEAPFRFPFLKSLVISLDAIEASHHPGYNQIIPLHWIRTGFGGNNRPRPMFSCTNCGRAVRRLYCKYASLKCRRCADAIYASQACNQDKRPALQTHRIKQFLRFKPLLWHRTRKRLQARMNAFETKPMPKRITDRAMLPQLNYQTGASPLWR